MVNSELSGWYALCAVDDLVATRVLAREVFAHRLAVFQDELGHVAVLDDRCPHGGLPLALGRVDNGLLVCAGHGWRFDAQGRCRVVPSSCSAEPLPACTPVRRYPVATHAGYHWVWIGKGTPFSLPLTFELPELGRAGIRVLQLRYRVRCEYQDAIDNLVDITHLPFVHVFPHMRDIDRRLLISLVEIETDLDQVVLRAGTPSQGSADAIAERRIEITFAAPTTVRLDFPRPAAGAASAMVACFVPQADDTTIVESTIVFPAADDSTAFTVARLDASADDPFSTLGRILDEDLVILVAQGRERRLSTAPDLVVAGDAMVAACRQHAKARSAGRIPAARTKRFLCRCGTEVPNWPVAE